MQLREVTLAELKQLYDTQFLQDFPKNEVRIWWSIEKMYAANHYKAFVLENNNADLLGYACFVYDDTKPAAMLDLFAIIENYRQDGYGSKFLQLLRKQLTCEALILEVETPETIEQQKRIDFYCKNGAIQTAYRWQAFDVLYDILYLPIKNNTQTDEQIAKQIRPLYDLALPADILDHKTQLQKIPC